MEPTLKTLKAALEAVRDTAMNALKQIEQPQEQHSMRWQCKSCRYMKHSPDLLPWKLLGDVPDARNTEFRTVS
jgi:hypothetical protein